MGYFPIVSFLFISVAHFSAGLFFFSYWLIEIFAKLSTNGCWCLFNHKRSPNLGCTEEETFCSAKCSTVAVQQLDYDTAQLHSTAMNSTAARRCGVRWPWGGWLWGCNLAPLGLHLNSALLHSGKTAPTLQLQPGKQSLVETDRDLSVRSLLRQKRPNLYREVPSPDIW